MILFVGIDLDQDSLVSPSVNSSMPEPPYTVRLLPSPNTDTPKRPSRSSHPTKSNATKHRRSAPPAPRLTLLNLPAALIHSSILPFLAPHRKLCHLSHISRSFPALDPTAFRHDCLTITTQQAAWFPKLHPSYLQLVSSCHSLWLQSNDGALSTANRDDVKRDILLSTLTLATAFGGVRRLRVPLPSVSLYSGVFLSRLVTSASSFARCHSVLLDDEDGLRKLTVEQVTPLLQLPVLRTVRLANCRLPLSTITFLCSLPTLTTLDTTECWYAPFDLSSIHCQPGTASSSQLRHLSLPDRSEGKAGARCTTKVLQHLTSTPARLSLSSLSLRGHASGDSGLLSFESLTSLLVSAVEPDFLYSLAGDLGLPVLPLLQHLSLSCHDLDAASRVSDRGSLQTMLYTLLELYRQQLRTVRLELPATNLLSNVLRSLSACPLLSCLHLAVRYVDMGWHGEFGNSVWGTGTAIQGGFRTLGPMPALNELVLDGVEWTGEQLLAVLQATPSLWRFAMTRSEQLTATALQQLSTSCPLLEQLHMSALHCAPPHQLMQLQQLSHLHSLGGLEYDTLPLPLQCCVHPPADDEDAVDMHWSSYGSSAHRGATAGVGEQDAEADCERWDGAAERALWWNALRFVTRVRVKGKATNGRQHFFHQLERLCAQNEMKSKRGGQRKQREKKNNVT